VTHGDIGDAAALCVDMEFRRPGIHPKRWTSPAPPRGCRCERWILV